MPLFIASCCYSSHRGDRVFSMVGSVSSENEKDQVEVMMDEMSDQVVA